MISFLGKSLSYEFEDQQGVTMVRASHYNHRSILCQPNVAPRTKRSSLRARALSLLCNASVKFASEILKGS